MRLVVFVIVMTVIFSALISDVTNIGQSSPSDLQAMGFGLCSEKPCFMSIIPGVTDFDDALRILQKYSHDIPPNYQSGQAIWLDEGPVLDLERSPFDTDNKVTYLAIGVAGAKRPVDMPRLGEFIRAYGKPCAVSSNLVGFEQVTLIYPFGAVFTSPDGAEWLGPNSKVDGFTLTAEPLKCDPGEYGTTWFGFASLQTFEAHGFPYILGGVY